MHPAQVLAADIKKAAVSAADVKAWAGMQPPPKAKGKPTPEWLEASKAATEAQAPFLKKLVEASGGKLKEKPLKKGLDFVLEKKDALDKEKAAYEEKGGAAYLAEKKKELAAMLA